MKRKGLILIPGLICVMFTVGALAASYNNAIWYSWSVEGENNVQNYLTYGCFISIHTQTNEIFVSAYDPYRKIYHDFTIKDGKLEKDSYFKELADRNIQIAITRPDIFFGMYLKILPDKIKNYFIRLYGVNPTTT